MRRTSRIILLTALLFTLAVLVLWKATGGDYYTKYQIIEQVEKPVDPNDPLAAAGFYDGQTRVETIQRDTFRFGLLPAPTGLFDKHIISVVSLAAPVWFFTLASLWVLRRRNLATQHIAHTT